MLVDENGNETSLLVDGNGSEIMELKTNQMVFFNHDPDRIKRGVNIAMIGMLITIASFSCASYNEENFKKWIGWIGLCVFGIVLMCIGRRMCRPTRNVFLPSDLVERGDLETGSQEQRRLEMAVQEQGMQSEQERRSLILSAAPSCQEKSEHLPRPVIGGNVLGPTTTGGVALPA